MKYKDIRHVNICTCFFLTCDIVAFTIKIMYFMKYFEHIMGLGSFALYTASRDD